MKQSGIVDICSSRKCQIAHWKEHKSECATAAMNRRQMVTSKFRELQDQLLVTLHKIPEQSLLLIQLLYCQWGLEACGLVCPERGSAALFCDFTKMPVTLEFISFERLMVEISAGVEIPWTVDTAPDGFHNILQTRSIQLPVVSKMEDHKNLDTIGLSLRALEAVGRHLQAGQAPPEVCIAAMMPLAREQYMIWAKQDPRMASAPQ